MFSFALDWAPAVPPLAAFALLLYLPGALVLWVAGLRPLPSLGLAPLVSAAIVGLTGVVVSMVGLSWSLGSVLAAAAAAILVVGLVRLTIERRRFRILGFDRLQWSWWVAGGLAINAGVVGWIYMRPTGSARAVPLEYDTIWHFAVIRRILETGDASSLNVGLLDGTEGSHFYPAAWHGLVALAIQTTGASPQAAVHGSVLVLLLITWPLGVMWLTRRLFGSAGVLSFAALSLACLPAVFPIGFLTFGLLYSNLFSYAMAPIALIVLMTALRRVGEREVDRESRWIAGVVLVGSIPWPSSSRNRIRCSHFSSSSCR